LNDDEHDDGGVDVEIQTIAQTMAERVSNSNFPPLQVIFIA
jgi:hypothetical protein